MITINLDELEKDWRAYLRRVEAGETVIVMRDNKPIAQIKPVQAEELDIRPYGLYKGLFTVPDDFDDPLPEEINRLFADV